MIAIANDGTADEIGDRFVSAEAVANEIIKRLMPNELSSHTAGYIRNIAQHGALYWRTMIFGGPNPLELDAVARPDGSLHLELQDCYSTRIWQIDLRPVAT